MNYIKTLIEEYTLQIPDYVIKLMTIAVLLILLVLGANKIYNIFYSADPVPVTITRDEIKQPQTIKDKINNEQSTKITLSQANDISKQIQEYEEEDKQPYEIIQTTKKDYEKVAAQEAKKQKADAVVITPAKDEKRDIDKLDDKTPVNLNQYNIEAYPKHMLGVTYYSDQEVTVDYDIKFRMFGKSAYVGPAVKFDTKTGNVAGGVKLTIPL